MGEWAGTDQAQKLGASLGRRHRRSGVCWAQKGSIGNWKDVQKMEKKKQISFVKKRVHKKGLRKKSRRPEFKESRRRSPRDAKLFLKKKDRICKEKVITERKGKEKTKGPTSSTPLCRRLAFGRAAQGNLGGLAKKTVRRKKGGWHAIKNRKGRRVRDMKEVLNWRKKTL